MSSIPHGTPVYSTADVRRIETAATRLPDRPQLMERAGLAAAEIARDLAADSGKPVLILAGPGNNGGDALVVARHLRQGFHNVTVVFTGDEKKFSPDSRAAFAAWRNAGGTVTPNLPSRRDWALVIDGLFGIGLQRDVAGPYATIIDAVNRMGVPVLAVDIPSGLDSDTGRVLGTAIRASHTATFIALKPGLLTLDGPDQCGEIHLCSLGLDTVSLLAPRGSVLGDGLLHTLLPPRRRNTHKGDYGSVGIIGGAPGMVGAALLAGRAALKLGTGRVYVGMLAHDAPAVDLLQPELMLRSAEEVLRIEHIDCLGIGPGLGQSPDALLHMQRALGVGRPLVVDADGLNLIASSAELKQATKQRNAATLLTPHPAEAARLLACSTAAVQADRVAAALQVASAFKADVVLKGAGSVCASPDGTWSINTSGHPGMATAGMGDVLTGILSALVAQGVPAQAALRGATWLHGAAADALVAAGTGPLGITSGETADAARALVNR